VVAGGHCFRLYGPRKARNGMWLVFTTQYDVQENSEQKDKVYLIVAHNFLYPDTSSFPGRTVGSRPYHLSIDHSVNYLQY
jgi:hypothetical protein